MEVVDIEPEEPQIKETHNERRRREAEEKMAAIEAKRAEYMDPEKNDKYMRELFRYEERTEIKGILPARERIKQYKTKTIKRNIPTSAQSYENKNRMLGSQSQSDLKGIKEVGGSRPVTAGMVSQFGQSQAPTAAFSGQASSALGNARAASMSRFSRFEENEKSVKSQNFKAFYTSSEPTNYHKENRFEGRSNYQYYYPTGETYEQELEKFWWDCKNKELADKRRDEEAKLIMKEWGQARGRMESEIARKKEHLNVATNFGEARGWTRTCWKSKNHNHQGETLDDFLNASESDDAEGEDKVKNIDLSDAESPMKYVAFGVNRSLRASATLSTRAAKVIDLAADDSKAYGLRPTTATMVKQLQAIDEYNKALPPRKRAKPENILPDIPAPNVHHFWGQVRDAKKGTVDLVRKFGNVGLIDAAESGNADMPLGSVHAFSIANQARELQVRASQNKIRNLRKHYGGLIGTIDSKMDKADNPFQGMMPAKDSKISSSEMSLSVYNRPTSLARPKTAKVNLLEGLPLNIAEKLEVQDLDENGVAIEKAPEQPADDRFPDAFEIPKDFVKKHKVPPKLLYDKDPTMLTRSGTEQARLETMVEMQLIQDKLSKDNCPSIPMKALERAVMVSSEVEWTPNPLDPMERKYPVPGADLMENPFPKPKKKKKGKKKKK